MTSETDKHRAVFLAAVMLLSVVVGTVAFSGSAAAIGDPQADGVVFRLADSRRS
jgi:surface glycoprotein (TIGR04207 family)